MRSVTSNLDTNSCSRRFATGALLSLALGGLNARESFAAALSGADPADKDKLVKVSEAINELGSRISNPESWPEIVQTLSQACSTTYYR